MPSRLPLAALAVATGLALSGASHAADVEEVAAVDGANLQRPSWAPDGSRLSYEANYHEKRTIELYVGDPRNRTFRRLKGARRSTNPVTAGFVTAKPATHVVHELTWGQASGGGYVFSASAEGQDFDLFLDGGGALAVAPGADGGPRWSPDGANLVFTSARTGAGDLYLLSADAMEAPPRRLTKAPGSSELFPDWSPDGTSLAYVTHNDTGDHVWLLEGLDGTPRQLTSEAGSQVRPRFSPDGGHVAYYAVVPPEDPETPERWDLVVRPIAADGVPVTLLEGVKPDLTGPTWTPSGAHLIVVRSDPEKLDPVAYVTVGDEASDPVDVDLGTVNHGDLAVTAAGDQLRLAFVAQGRVDDPVRTFKRLFVTTIPAAPPAAE